MLRTLADKTIFRSNRIMQPKKFQFDEVYQEELIVLSHYGKMVDFSKN